MEDLKEISYPDLVEMLATYTTWYLELLTGESASDESNVCQDNMDLIVEELRSRMI